MNRFGPSLKPSTPSRSFLSEMDQNYRKMRENRRWSTRHPNTLLLKIAKKKLYKGKLNSTRVTSMHLLCPTFYEPEQSNSFAHSTTVWIGNHMYFSKPAKCFVYAFSLLCFCWLFFAEKCGHYLPCRSSCSRHGPKGVIHTLVLRELQLASR